MCSQPIVQATQPARVFSRRGAELFGRDLGRALEGPALKVARRQRAKRLNVSRFVAVPSSRYLAVAGPNDRLRQVAAELGQLVRMRPLAALRAAHGDRLDVLAAQHGAAAAAAGVAAVVRDRRVADRVLAGGADRGDLIVGAKPRAQRRLGHLACGAAKVRRPARDERCPRR